MRILFLSSILLLQACATLGPKYSGSETKISKDKAIVTIYRPWKYVGSVGDPYTCLDNVAVGEYYNGSFYNLELEPGEHYFSWGTMDEQSKKNGVKFIAKKGEEYFLRFDISKLQGAKEATQAGAMAGAGAVGVVAAGAFFSASSPEEIKRILDSRVQKEANNQGLMFVKKDFALTELPNTKQYTVKKYDTNWCSAAK